MSIQLIFITFKHLCSHHHSAVLQLFRHLSLTLQSILLTVLFHPPSQQPPIYFMSLIAFSGDFIENVIMQYVVFHVWLLSLSIMLLRVIYVVACISSLFLLVKSSNFAVFCFVNVPHSVYLFSGESFGLFPVWDCYEEHCCELLHVRICVDVSYHFF